MTIFEASVLSVVEGLTEYLPISSTAHIILAQKLMGIEDTPFFKSFLVMVQFGPILAVMVEYFRLLTSHWRLYPVLFVAFLPVAVVGLPINKLIERLQESLLVVGASLLVGGIVLVFTDRIFPAIRAKHNRVENTSYRQAVVVGFFQCLGMIPGMSRSASTIWGGLAVKMDQKTATEFSFLLALPTLTAATLFKGYKGFSIFTGDDLKVLLLGNVISFVVGWITIRSFLHYVVKHSFRVFGYYRILVGAGTLCACWFYGLR